ncbi:YdcA family protein [Methylorubrum extorquens]
MSRTLVLTLVAAGMFAIGTPAEARNTPCSGKKGGIKACQGDKFLCNNGTLSASKKRRSR